MLVEFASVLDALRAAAAVQGEMARRNADVAPERRIEFRIGIHQGDIVVEDGDIFGDGVNVAARLEGIAEPGGICVSARVQEDAAGTARSRFRGYRRAGAEEHRAAGAGVPGAAGTAGLRPALPATTPAVQSVPLPFPTSRRSRCCRSRT